MRKNKTTKYLVIMLTIVITIAMMPTMAFAADQKTSGGAAVMWRESLLGTR